MTKRTPVENLNEKLRLALQDKTQDAVSKTDVSDALASTDELKQKSHAREEMSTRVENYSKNLREELTKEVKDAELKKQKVELLAELDVLKAKFEEMRRTDVASILHPIDRLESKLHIAIADSLNDPTELLDIQKAMENLDLLKNERVRRSKLLDLIKEYRGKFGDANHWPAKQKPILMELPKLEKLLQEMNDKEPGPARETWDKGWEKYNTLTKEWVTSMNGNKVLRNTGFALMAAGILGLSVKAYKWILQRFVVGKEKQLTDGRGNVLIDPVTKQPYVSKPWFPRLRKWVLQPAMAVGTVIGLGYAFNKINAAPPEEKKGNEEIGKIPDTKGLEWKGNTITFPARPGRVWMVKEKKSDGTEVAPKPAVNNQYDVQADTASITILHRLITPEAGNSRESSIATIERPK